MVNITDIASIALYNRGPLTTLYQPAASCYSTLTVPSTSKADTVLYVGHFWDEYFDTACFPTGTKQYSELTDEAAWTLYYYSPGVCPSGWHTGKVLTSGMAREPGTTMIISSDTSAVVCCPSGYNYALYDHLCASPITKGQPITYRSPTRQLNDWLPGIPITTTFSSETLASADGVVVFWRESDEALLSKATPTPLASTISTSSTITNGSLAPPGSTAWLSASDSNERTLSIGAIVGLAVGILAATIAGMVLGVYMYRRKAKSAAVTSPPALRTSDPKTELCSMSVSELHTQSPPGELQDEPTTHSGLHELQ